MRSRQAGIVLIVASVVAGVIFPGAIRATSGYIPDVHNGTALIASGEHFAFDFVVYGEFTEVGYQFGVESGPNVDIYFFTPDDLQRYRAGQPYSDLAMAAENVRSLDESPYASEGRFTAVVDNSDYGIAAPDGSDVFVRYHLSGGGVPGETHDDYITKYVVFGLGLILLGFLFLVGVILIIVGAPTQPFYWR